jgi:hypothetical protein
LLQSAKTTKRLLRFSISGGISFIFLSQKLFWLISWKLQKKSVSLQRNIKKHKKRE